jgi:hypothetical protein
MGTWRHLKTALSERQDVWNRMADLDNPKSVTVLLGFLGVFLGAVIVFPGERQTWQWLLISPWLYLLAVVALWALAAWLPKRFHSSHLRRVLGIALSSASYGIAIGELVFGVFLAVVLSISISKFLAIVIFWLLGAPLKRQGTFEPAANYLILTTALIVLAYGKRWIVIPFIKLMNFPAKGEGHLLWERTLMHGILAMDFRRRAYEIAIILLVTSTFADFGVLSSVDLRFGLQSKALFSSLLTFLAIDAYLVTFLPEHLQAEDSIDVAAVQSKLVTRTDPS